MKCTIPEHELHRLRTVAAVSRGNKIDEKRQFVKVESNGTTAKLTGTDGENFVSCVIDANGDECSFAINFSVAERFASGLSDLEVTVNGTSIDYVQGNSSGNITTVDPDTVPKHSVPDMSDAPQFDGDLLIRSLSTAVDCSDKGSTSARFALQGAQLKMSGGELVVNGTDGRKAFSVSIDSDSSAEFDVIVPHASLKHMRSLSRQAIKIKTDASSITLSDGQLVYTCRLVSGRFPDVAKLLSKSDGEHVISTDTQSLIQGAESILWDDDKLVIKGSGLETLDGKRKFSCELSAEFDPVTVSYANLKPLISSFDHCVIKSDGGSSPLFIELGDSAVGMIAPIVAN